MKRPNFNEMDLYTPPFKDPACPDAAPNLDVFQRQYLEWEERQYWDDEEEQRTRGR